MRRSVFIVSPVPCHGLTHKWNTQRTPYHRVSTLKRRTPTPFPLQHRQPIQATTPLRIGHGYDLHRLEPGLPLKLGGINLKHDRGCAGHSDGDVIYHCVVDAILGALGLPDIGQMFPDSDIQYKGKDSSWFIQQTRKEMRKKGWNLTNLDLTIILERPKLSPVKDKIKDNIARELGVHTNCINVKAKTHEKVDAVGEGRAVEAHAVVLLSKDSNSFNEEKEEEKELLKKRTSSVTKSIGESMLNLVGDRASTIDEVTRNALEKKQVHVMDRLFQTILKKRKSDPTTSWTANLFSKGITGIAQKIGEEATEVVIDAVDGNQNGVVKESADLLYHLNVLWAQMGIHADDVWKELASREGISGIQEKASRSQQ